VALSGPKSASGALVVDHSDKRLAKQALVEFLQGVDNRHSLFLNLTVVALARDFDAFGMRRSLPSG